MIFGKKAKDEEKTNKSENGSEPPGSSIDKFVGKSVLVKHNGSVGRMHEVFVIEVAPNAPAVLVKFSTRKFPIWDSVSSFEVVDIVGDTERDFYNSIRRAAVKKGT